MITPLRWNTWTLCAKPMGVEVHQTTADLLRKLMGSAAVTADAGTATTAKNTPAP